MASVSRRYARALVDAILAQKIDADIARLQLRSIGQAVHDSDDLRRVWESPAVSPVQKRAVLDAIVNDRDYEFLERELIADWRVHYARACAKMKDLGLQALRRVLERERPKDVEAAAELEALVNRLAGAE